MIKGEGLYRSDYNNGSVGKPTGILAFRFRKVLKGLGRLRKV